VSRLAATHPPALESLSAAQLDTEPPLSYPELDGDAEPHRKQFFFEKKNQKTFASLGTR
jgi:hypothetical protein